MNRVRVVVALIALVTATQAAAQLQCNRGPLSRNYGGASWLVYACSDEHSLIFVTPPGSKAHPFIFSLIYQDGAGYRFSGEGTGDRSVTDVAAREIQALGGEDI